MNITTKHDLKQHLGRTGFFIWARGDGSRIVAYGPKAVSTGVPGRRWHIRHEAAGGEVLEERDASNYMHAGSLMWDLAHEATGDMPA